MSRLSLAPGGDPRLAADFGPGLMQRGVQLEAGFILEQDGCSLPFRFFLEPGMSFATTTPGPANQLDSIVFEGVAR